MLQNSPDVSVEKRSWSRPRTPALVAAIAFAGGIALDRSQGDRFHWDWLLTAALVVGLIWLVLAAIRSRFAVIAAVGLVATSGICWHHHVWSIANPKHVVRYAASEATPLRLRATVLDAPVLVPHRLPDFATAWPGEEKSRCHLQAEAILLPERNIPVTGRLRLTVTGRIPHVRDGDRIEVGGTLRRLTPARNPGTYDFAESMRREGVLCTLFCEHADGIVVRDRQQGLPAWSPPMLLSGLRQRISHVYEQVFETDVAAMANALVLGERSGLDGEISLNFRRSGLMHLLSISGLHVALIGVVAGAIAIFLRPETRFIQWLALGGMTLSLLLAEFRPPVFRAWLLGVLLVASSMSFRPWRTVQALGLTAWVCLIVNPTWLFDAGAQLSFLGIVAILGCWKWLPDLLGRTGDGEPIDPTEEPSAWSGPLSIFGRFLFETCIISLAVTLCLLPVIGQSFHLVSLAGIPATVLALLLLTLALPGLLVIALGGLLSTVLVTPLAWPVSRLLWLMAEIAQLFSQGPLQWMPARIPFLVVLCFVFIAGILIVQTRSRIPRLKPVLLASWVVLLAAGFSPVSHRTLEAMLGQRNLELRALSVGHGNACLLRCPNGRTILLDAGSMENGQAAANAVMASLSDMGCDRLDAILISHTDTDHLNAVPFLLRDLPVRAVLLNPVGLNPHHRGLAAVVAAASEAQVPLRVVRHHDEIALDPEVRIRVRQSGNSPIAGRVDDNEHSVVVEVGYAGHRLLFPGDVSGAGQQRLFETSAESYSVIVAPHHGGRRENTPEFANWARPEAVIVSTGDAGYEPQFTEVYNRSRLTNTAEGAVRVRITSQGKLNLDRWAADQRWASLAEKPR
ncbi:ComEC/Rec2 family competence protein [Rubinisphaera margarita]|uniref:ComEC/Rec2 family competence protein n=1 Tax=Rubinisphaera margarita TaxID=2909586 RepID=UPI001EE7CBDF|nr:ComEC/Rec2 family competence protein [Rubinisphaera margarita]MCG6155208.1 ComEC/Rec2 family competence protein [Rubinisphaera margarita]